VPARVPGRRGLSFGRGPGASSLWLPAPLTGLPGLALLALVGVLLAILPAGGSAQQGWNQARVLELIERARERRAAPYADSALVNYRADANGRIYFYLDREDTDERTLVKVDQVALEVFWAYPGLTRQRIVGLRDESLLPNRMRYHLDHLTVVQNEFGDDITLGDGDEVRAVRHPVAAVGEGVYDYRLADSLTLRLSGLPEPLRVYEVQVRPRDAGRPGFVGSVFLDRATADIVRMDFTFTPASYVDQRLDYIRISLENGLWQGGFWLPYEQRAELRRQLPMLDFPAGGVIRLHMRVGGYEFNEPLPPTFFRGPRVVAVPESERRAYPFEEGLLAELDEEGLTEDADLDRLAEQAAALARQQYLSGLPRLRLDIRGASSVLRYNRTEGLYLGGGLSYALGAGAEARAGFGWAFGPDVPQARGALSLPVGSGRVRLSGRYNAPRDLDPTSIAGAINTLSSLSAAAGAGFGHDFLDLYFERGGGLLVEAPLPLQRWTARLEFDVADQISAGTLADEYEPEPGDELKRPLPVVDEGLLTQLALGARMEADGYDGVALDAHGRLGWLDGEEHIRLDAGAAYRFGLPSRPRGAVRLRAGWLSDDGVLDQWHFWIGGRGTVPGFPYRAFTGTSWSMLDAEFEWPLAERWLTARALGSAAAWTGPADDERPIGAPASFDAEGVRGSVGLGLGVVHDILRLDLHRGIGPGGDWELLLSVAPRLHDIL